MNTHSFHTFDLFASNSPNTIEECLCFLFTVLSQTIILQNNKYETQTLCDHNHSFLTVDIW